MSKKENKFNSKVKFWLSLFNKITKIESTLYFENGEEFYNGYFQHGKYHGTGELKYQNNYSMTKLLCENNIVRNLNNFVIIRPAYLFDSSFEPNMEFINPLLKYLKYLPFL